MTEYGELRLAIIKDAARAAMDESHRVLNDVFHQKVNEAFGDATPVPLYDVPDIDYAWNATQIEMTADIIGRFDARLARQVRACADRFRPPPD